MPSDRKPSPRYSIGEWFGHRYSDLDANLRRKLAVVAQDPDMARAVKMDISLLSTSGDIACPFKYNRGVCSKKGGVCSIQQYEATDSRRIGTATSGPAVTCPQRFEEGNVLLKWLADIMSFDLGRVLIAREVPFMKSESTGRPAGKIDWVLAQENRGSLRWCALEIQAVYFSGKGMASDFMALQNDSNSAPPFPSQVRRPDWRSSSAKRLMPQLQVKVPTLRRWGAKMAVAVDEQFFRAIGGQSEHPSQDLDNGDIVWMVPHLAQDGNSFGLRRGTWEVLTLEQSSEKLLSAKTVSRRDFETNLRSKLVPLSSR